ncbi:MAG: hypothetical protein Kow00106_12790 [Anaerolineae bacterium]
MRRWLFWLGLMVGLTGCALSGSGKGSAANVHAALSARLEEIRTAQNTALTLWDRVIAGETMSCQEAIPVPAAVTLSERERTAYPPGVAVAEALNEAIGAIRNAADLWAIECADVRPVVPLDMARAGRNAALAATAPLDRATILLAAGTP